MSKLNVSRRKKHRKALILSNRKLLNIPFKCIARYTKEGWNTIHIVSKIWIGLKEEKIIESYNLRPSTSRFYSRG